MSKNIKPQVFGPNLLDVRVRERFLTSGLLDPKVLEKHKAELVDVGDRCESVDLSQPALSASESE